MEVRGGEALRNSRSRQMKWEREPQGQAQNESGPKSQDSGGAWERGGGEPEEAECRKGSWSWHRAQKAARRRAGGKYSPLACAHLTTESFERNWTWSVSIGLSFTTRGPAGGQGPAGARAPSKMPVSPGHSGMEEQRSSVA